MLVLKIKPGESIVLLSEYENIELGRVKFVAADGNGIKLGFQFDRKYKILREEVLRRDVRDGHRR